MIIIVRYSDDFASIFTSVCRGLGIRDTQIVLYIFHTTQMYLRDIKLSVGSAFKISKRI